MRRQVRDDVLEELAGVEDGVAGGHGDGEADVLVLSNVLVLSDVKSYRAVMTAPARGILSENRVVQQRRRPREKVHGF